jgi:hypothetical protein
MAISAKSRRAMLVLLAGLVVSAGCAGNVVTIVRVDEQEVMSRWNAVVPSGWDFRWEIYDRFPHPTFKGGSEMAYQRFAQVLVSFLQSSDNFQYLAHNQLFTYPLSSYGTMMTLIDYTEMLLGDDWVGFSASTLQSLRDLDDRMRAAAAS